MKLNKKTVLVTGGSKGIGKSIAQRFIREGAKVIVFSREKPDYEVEFYRVDVRKEEEIAEAFGQIKELDILVNNAGVYLRRSVEETSKEELDQVVDTNLKGIYLVAKYAIPLIRKSGGSIINIASAAAVAPNPDSPAYCATKAAVVMLTKCMALEYAGEGIRVNAILPGLIDTPLLRKAFSSDDVKEREKITPLKRIGKPEDVANLAVFLASDQANYITGGSYAVDGGRSASNVFYS